MLGRQERRVHILPSVGSSSPLSCPSLPPALPRAEALAPAAPSVILVYGKDDVAWWERSCDQCKETTGFLLSRAFFLHTLTRPTLLPPLP